MKSFKAIENGQKKVVNIYDKETAEVIDTKTPNMGQRVDALKRDIEYSNEFDSDTMYLRVKNI